MSESFRVVDMRVFEGKNGLVAFADIEFSDGVRIRGFGLREREDGYWLAVPRRGDGKGRFFDIVELPPGLKRRVLDVVLAEYEQLVKPAA